MKRKDTEITIIQVYAPTAESDEAKINEFYDKLSDVMQDQKISKKRKLIIMGDLNSQIGMGKTEERDIIGEYCYGKRNERGERLIDFCAEQELKIINTFFEKRKARRWTWLSPNQKYKTQIDYIITPKNEN